MSHSDWSGVLSIPQASYPRRGAAACVIAQGQNRLSVLLIALGRGNTFSNSNRRIRPSGLHQWRPIWPFTLNNHISFHLEDSSQRNPYLQNRRPPNSRTFFPINLNIVHSADLPRPQHYLAIILFLEPECDIQCPLDSSSCSLDSDFLLLSLSSLSS